VNKVFLHFFFITILRIRCYTLKISVKFDRFEKLSNRASKGHTYLKGVRKFNRENRTCDYFEKTNFDNDTLLISFIDNS